MNASAERQPGYPFQFSGDERVRMYEAVLSTTPDLVYVFDLNHRFIYANAALLGMWGKTWDEAIGKTCLELGYEEWHAKMHDDEIDQVVATGKPVRGEVPFDGTYGLRIYDYIFTPVFGDDGKVSVVAGTTRDVTERKRDETKAAFLDEFTRKVALWPAGKTPLKVAMELIGKFLKVSRCILGEGSKKSNRITVLEDWSREGLESIQGEHVLNEFGDGHWWEDYTSGFFSVPDVFTHPRTQEKADAYTKMAVRSYAAQSRVGEGDRVLILSITDEKPRDWQQDELLLLDDVLGRLRPLADRWRIEVKLSQQKERLELLWKAADILLRSEDPEMMLQQIFDTISGHLGLDVYINFMARPEGLYLSSFRGLLPEEVERIRVLELGQAICGTVALTRHPVVANRLQSSDDPRASFVRGMGIRAYVCNPLVVGDHLLGTLSFGSRKRAEFSEEDTTFIGTITHYVTAAYMRLRLVNDLRESDRKKDQFLATLAHELRNPISPILTGLEVIRRSSDDPQRIALVSEMIRQQTGHMVHLIDDLLELSRITTGKFVLRPGLCDLSELAANVAEVIRPSIEQKRQELVVDFPVEKVVVDCDSHRMSQVISNLLLNAHKYTPSGGRIRLAIGETRDYVVLEVEDNRIGIDAASQKKVFEMFVQEDSDRQDGLGIGLTLVKSLVEMHGGSVRLSSEGRGKGCRFEVRIPQIRKREMSGDRSPQQHSGGPLSGRVLVVDDEKQAAQILQMMLESEGLEVEVAFDGVEAVEHVRSFKPDVVFMDLGMPRMDGFEAASLIAKMNPEVQLVALSGWGRNMDKEKSQSAGFIRHMVKPVSPDEIRSVLEELGLRHAVQQEQSV